MQIKKRNFTVSFHISKNSEQKEWTVNKKDDSKSVMKKI
jgi:hypothetical protein